LIRRGDGLLISDINPRVGTSSAFTLGRGVNLPEFLCRQIGGGRVAWDHQLVGQLKGTRVVRRLTDSWYRVADFQELRGLVFDLDDTLIDQKRWIYEKFLLLADRFSGQLGTTEGFVTTAMRIVEEGDRRTTIDAAIASLGLDPALREPLIEAYRELEPEVCRTFPDVIPSLLTLRQMGLKIGILTDNPPDSQRQKLRRAGRLEELADAIVLTREVGEEKPAPAGYLKIAQCLDLPPAVLAAVGDNPYRDAAGAMAAGYGHVFLVARAQGLFNMDEAIYRNSFAGQRGEYLRVDDLRALVACLNLGRRTVQLLEKSR